MAQINLEDLLHKTENQGATDAGRLTAAEWNKLVQAVMANQGAVKKITFNSRDYLPDENGTVTMTILDSGVSYVVQLDTLSDQDNIISTDERVKLRMRFLSQSYNQITQALTDTHEDGTALVQFKAANSDTWQDGGTVNIASVPMEDEDAYEELDITNMIPSGASQVRVKVTGNTTMLETTFVVFRSIVKTIIGLTAANEWQQPITGNVLPLLFFVRGSVAKTLNLRISGQGGMRQLLASNNTGISLGTAIYTERPYQADLTDLEADTVKVLSHGVHSIEAWLTVDGTDIESAHVKMNLMVASDPEDTTPYLIVNSLKTNIDNFTNNRLFQYAIYSPENISIPVKFRFSDYAQANIFLESTVQAAPGQVYDFTNMLEIDSELSSVTAYLRAFYGQTSLLTATAITVDNSQNFSPTAGAALFINPKLRTNSDGTPGRILNAAADNAAVPAVFNGFGWVTDGWVADSQGRRCLRVPAGRSIDIDYEAFSDFLGEQHTGSLTIEFDFNIHDVTDEAEPIIRMCSYSAVDDEPLGLEIRPLNAVFMTLGNRTRRNQDAGWQEGERTHLVVNILYNLYASGINYIRFFIDGKIKREMTYATDDTFVQYVGAVKTSQGIRIGSTGADIDIYGLKVYKSALGATEVRQDRLAAFDTGAEKQAFRQENDILDDNGYISFNKVRQKGLNYLLWHGQYATYGNTKNDKFTGDLDVHIAGDPEHSGTLHNMEEKGQGTSSMLYYIWNGAWSFKEGGYWEDETGVNHGAKYQMCADIPAAKKLAGKVNYASSMQSHKIGSCNLYDALQKAVVGGHSINEMEGYENARSSVKQLPFYLFVQEDGDAAPTFRALMTFGPAKGDKPTFGVDLNLFPDRLIIEGADNDMPLLMHRIPWLEDEVVLDDEDWKYNGAKQVSLVAGNTDSISYFIAAFNFCFKHYDKIAPFVGTYEQLAAAEDLDIATHYWVTEASASAAVADLFRHDDLTETWVPAGTTKVNGVCSTLNLLTQTNSSAEYVGDHVVDNEMFKAKRLADFKAGIGDYFDLPDTFFTMNFTKLIAASDNRGKNIYFDLDDETHLIGWNQDDLDTILDTNNVGQSEKPYYVEVHDTKPDGGYYWNSEGNSFFNNMENAYATELRTAMKQLLSSMASLSDDSTPMGCIKKFYISIQDYFCAAAYNENARILYEAGQKALMDGTYVNGTEPITQSRGDQKQNELQWWSRRLAYISSYAQYGEFGCADGGRSAGSLNFRSIVLRNGSRPSYSFKLVPHIWLYPSAAIGQSMSIGQGNSLPVRCQPGVEVTLNAGQSDGNTNVFLEGIDWYREIGNFADKSLNGNFNLSGARLQKFEAYGEELPQFRPDSMTIAATKLQRLVLNGISTLSGNLDLASLTRLEYLDLRGTGLSSVGLPTSEYLKKIYLPGTLTSLAIRGLNNIEECTLAGVANLQTVVLENGASSEWSHAFFSSFVSMGANILNLRVTGANWQNVTVAELQALANIPTCVLTGTLAVTGRISSALKMALMAKWGNIDSAANALRITYTEYELGSFQLAGATYLPHVGDSAQFSFVTAQDGNNLKAVEWSLSDNAEGYARISSAGLLEVLAIPDEPTDITVTCTVTKSDDTTDSATLDVGLYEHYRTVGDYVYADGSFSDKLDLAKTVVGIAYYVSMNKDWGMCVAPKDLGSMPWGLYNNASSGVANIILEDPDNADYSVYDLADVPNTTSAAGEEVVLTENLYGLPRGTKISRALQQTLLIIKHRDRLLSDSSLVGISNLAIPEVYAEIWHVTPMAALETILGYHGTANTRQWLYPAASYCHAYAPQVKAGETLSDKFKAGKWCLPGTGDLSTCYTGKSKGYSDPTVEGAIFAKAYLAGVFTQFASAYYWTCCEYGATFACYVNLSNGQVGGNSTIKSNSFAVRPVAAF